MKKKRCRKVFWMRLILLLGFWLRAGYFCPLSSPILKWLVFSLISFASPFSFVSLSFSLISHNRSVLFQWRFLWLEDYWFMGLLRFDFALLYFASLLSLLTFFPKTYIHMFHASVSEEAESDGL